MVTFRLSWS